MTLPEIGHVVGFVGQDQAGGRITFHQPLHRLGLRRIAADEAVRPELKYIAEARDGDGAGLGRKRSLLDAARPFAEHDLIDLVERETRDLDRSVGQDQFLDA